MRILALVLAVVAGAISVEDYLAWRSQQRRLASLAAGAAPGDLAESLVDGLERETVAARAVSRLAWRLLRLELDRGWLEHLPQPQRLEEGRRGRERLRLARQLAEEALAAQPTAWRAAVVIGASRYLEVARSDRREQTIAAWSEPLRAAMRLAPNQPEPPFLLASFYLSRWSSLSPAERQEVPAVLERAFCDPSSLRRLLPAWVRLAPTLGGLLEPLPDRPRVWLELGREFLRLGDLERYAIAHRRWVEALPAELATRVRNGAARLRGGHAKAGLGLLRSVFAAPPDLAYGDTFAAALAALPPDAGDASTDLADWSVWASELCAIGRCPLDETAMARLMREAGASPPLTPPGGTPEPAAGAAWSADDWRRRGATYSSRLRLSRPARRLSLELAGVPPTGAVVELRWNGGFLGVAALAPGERLSWPLDAAAGLHLLELRHLTGRGLRPQRLTLDPASPGA